MLYPNTLIHATIIHFLFSLVSFPWVILCRYIHISHRYRLCRHLSSLRLFHRVLYNAFHIDIIHVLPVLYLSSWSKLNLPPNYVLLNYYLLIDFNTIKCHWITFQNTSYCILYKAFLLTCKILDTQFFTFFIFIVFIETIDGSLAKSVPYNLWKNSFVIWNLFFTFSISRLKHGNIEKKDNYFSNFIFFYRDVMVSYQPPRSGGVIVWGIINWI